MQLPVWLAGISGMEGYAVWLAMRVPVAFAVGRETEGYAVWLAVKVAVAFTVGGAVGEMKVPLLAEATGPEAQDEAVPPLVTVTTGPKDDEVMAVTFKLVAVTVLVEAQTVPVALVATGEAQEENVMVWLDRTVEDV